MPGGLFGADRFPNLRHNVVDSPASLLELAQHRQWTPMSLKSMSIGKLSKLGEHVDAALSTKVIEERRAL